MAKQVSWEQCYWPFKSHAFLSAFHSVFWLILLVKKILSNLTFNNGYYRKQKKILIYIFSDRLYISSLIWAHCLECSVWSLNCSHDFMASKFLKVLPFARWQHGGKCTGLGCLWCSQSYGVGGEEEEVGSGRNSLAKAATGMEGSSGGERLSQYWGSWWTGHQSLRPKAEVLRESLNILFLGRGWGVSVCT